MAGPNARPIEHRMVFRTIRLITPCWEVTSHKPTKGYIALGGGNGGRRRMRLHREMFRCLWGEITDGKIVCHHCENPPCCNHLHLYLGDDAANVADMARRGRLRPPRGEQNGMANLTEQKVLEITTRSSAGESQSKLARDFGVSPATINRILRNKAWAHVQPSETVAA
jgi:DNA-binding XRE family transcriptional regulator